MPSSGGSSRRIAKIPNNPLKPRVPVHPFPNSQLVFIIRNKQIKTSRPIAKAAARSLVKVFLFFNTLYKY